MTSQRMTCTCGQEYTVNTSARVAQPGHQVRSEHRIVGTDADGVRRHRTRRSAFWVSDGDPVKIRRMTDSGATHETYEWVCGDHRAVIELPAYDVVVCRACGGHKRPDPMAPLSQPKPKCPCCGDNPNHLVNRDPDAQPRPWCLTATEAA